MTAGITVHVILQDPQDYRVVICKHSVAVLAAQEPCEAQTASDLACSLATHDARLLRKVSR